MLVDLGDSIKAAWTSRNKSTVKTFILNEFLAGEDPALTDTTALTTTGILDSSPS
jgi:hypothetical protein